MKQVYRAFPCPVYEIGNVEGWLTDCAREGLLLAEDGFFLGFAVFEPTEPKSVRYRLLPVEKVGSLWDNTTGEPDEEQLELSARYGWEYVARKKDFYVFRSFDPCAIEPNTDGSVAALALNTVKKRQRSALCSSGFSLFVYPLLLTRFCPLLTTIVLGTAWTLLALALGLGMFLRKLQAFRQLKRLQAELTEGVDHGPVSDWRKRKLPYLFGKGLGLVLTVVLLCGLFRIRGRDIPLSEYRGTLPFATIADLAGEGCTDYAPSGSIISDDFNRIEERSDLLAPRFLSYNEYATVKKADGQPMDGGLYVDYLELRSPALAREALRELYRLERFRNHVTPTDAPTLNADEVIACTGVLHTPSLFIRKGHIVAHISFYQFSSAYTMPVEEWGKKLCESLPK